MKPRDYISTHCVRYPSKPQVNVAFGYTSIRCLQFLDGRKWDEVAIGFVHALRPSGIRVTEDAVTLDAMTWRVTVVVDNLNDLTIKRITQEVEVWLPEGVQDGHDLDSRVDFKND